MSPGDQPRLAEKVARLTRWLLPATLIATVVATGAWWVTSPSRVTVVADGERVSLRTRATTVADVLEERQIRVGAHDRVFPPLEARLDDGQRIRVLRARPIAVDLNGSIRTVWTTGRHVRDVLRELALEPDVVEPGPGASLSSGQTLVLRDAHRVTVLADGRERDLLTSALRVGELLTDLHISLDPDDEVTPAPGSAVNDGMDVVVTRVDSEVAVEEDAIPFHTVRRNDPSLTRGEVRTIQSGRPGLERVRSRLVRRNGAVVDRTVLSRERVREPRARILAIGTKPRRVQSGRASWYSGASMVCAHRSLPFGTRITVVNLSNGASVVCRVSDRGPWVAGRVIDLSYSAFRQLASPGVGVISVRISW